MIPESKMASEIRLYKAIKFPTQWSFIRTLLIGDYADPSIFYFKNRLWMFAEKGRDSLYLYYAKKIMGPWV